MDEPHVRARLIVARCPDGSGEMALSREETSHARARRLKPGDPLALIDGTGAEARATWIGVSRGIGRVFVDEIRLVAAPGERIALLVAGLKLERLSWVTEKATELGVGSLTLVSTGRTQRDRASETTVERLTRVAQAAAKQCGSARWPAVSGPRDFAQVISEMRDCTRLFLDSRGSPFPDSLGPPLAILVGPEGGWTDEERAFARTKGWTPAALPAGPLRAETAAIAAVVLARAALARMSSNVKRKA